MKRVLIVGISSCLGSGLAAYLRRYYQVYGTYGVHRPPIDGVPVFRLLLEPETPLPQVVRKLRPNAIVYAAGLTDPAACEREPERAFFLNAQAPAVLAEAVHLIGGRFIYLSSSKVFPGTSGPYEESDRPSPKGVYGASKRGAEERLARFDRTFILRLGTVFALGGRGQNSMLSRLLRQILTRTKTKLVVNELRSFIPGTTVIDAVARCLDADPAAAGIFHLGNDEPVSYYDFGCRLATALGHSADCFEPVRGAVLHPSGTPHQFPDLRLVGDRLRGLLGQTPGSLAQSLAALRLQLHMGQI